MLAYQQAEGAPNEDFGIANIREHARLKPKRSERYVGVASPGAAANVNRNAPCAARGLHRGVGTRVSR